MSIKANAIMSIKAPPESHTHSYYKALQQVFAIQSEHLTAALPHMGERGANDEGRCSAFLRQVLPQRYSIGSGFIVSSESDEYSPQQDIVIFDDLNNSPLQRELSAAVFPVEIVYATVEVKRYLDRAEIRSTVDSVGRTRKHGMRCYYLAQPGDLPGRKQRRTAPYVKKPPWAFVFVYRTSYVDIESFRSAWEEVCAENNSAHIHGVIVIDKDWYCHQLANQPKPTFEAFRGDALLRFTNSLMNLLRTSVIHEADINQYLRIPVAPDDFAKVKKRG